MLLVLSKGLQGSRMEPLPGYEPITYQSKIHWASAFRRESKSTLEEYTLLQLPGHWIAANLEFKLLSGWEVKFQSPDASLIPWHGGCVIYVPSSQLRQISNNFVSFSKVDLKACSSEAHNVSFPYIKDSLETVLHLCCRLQSQDMKFLRDPTGWSTDLSSCPKV